MNKGKVARLAGFVGALGLSTVLVTTAVQGTGAWFTSSAGGSVSAGSGHLTLLTQAVDNASSNYVANRTNNLTYSNLMPGTPVNHTIGYKVDASSGNVDLWLVFNGTDAEYSAFTGGLNQAGGHGVSGATDEGGLGRYGYFAVSDATGGQAFASGNLAFPYASGNGNVFNDPQATGNCSTDANNGRGGDSTVYQAGPPEVNPGWCGVPKKILLRWNMAAGDTGAVTVTFGLNGDKTTGQNDTHISSLPYELVATQAGHRP